MLEKHSDAEVVRAWLREAIDAYAKRSPADSAPRRRTKTATALATHCGVSPQAVNGWLKTGRITKSNLTRAVEFFGHGPDFVQPARRLAHTYSVADRWPFTRITFERFSRLLPPQRDRIEAYAEGVLSEFEASTHGRNKGPAAA